MNNSSTIISRKKWSPWVLGIVIFFLVVVSVNTVLLCLAISSHGGLIEENPYEKGLVYQETIELLERSAHLGWKKTLSYTAADTEGNREVTLSVFDAEDNPVVKADVFFEARRPSSASLDIAGELDEDIQKPGTYGKKLNLPARGLWFVTVRVRRGKDEWLWQGREHLR